MSLINLNEVAVDFPIYNLTARSIKQQFLSLTTGGVLGSNSRDKLVVKALNNISFTLKHGDRVGLIGHNGSGKSTLLRVLAKIYEPTSGSLTIDGRISSLLDINLGSNLESTGYENIMIQGLLLGLTRSQINEKLNDIIQFSELGNYLSMPIRTYSSGMQLRLSFSIATSFKPDILLMDEIIMVGDQSFINKAKSRLSSFVAQASIMVLASHSMDVIKQFCNKAIYLENGQLTYFGTVDEAFIRYQN